MLVNLCLCVCVSMFVSVCVHASFVLNFDKNDRLIIVTMKSTYYTENLFKNLKPEVGHFGSLVSKTVLGMRNQKKKNLR